MGASEYQFDATCRRCDKLEYFCKCEELSKKRRTKLVPEVGETAWFIFHNRPCKATVTKDICTNLHLSGCGWKSKKAIFCTKEELLENFKEQLEKL